MSPRVGQVRLRFLGSGLAWSRPRAVQVGCRFVKERSVKNIVVSPTPSQDCKGVISHLKATLCGVSAFMQLA